MEPPPQQPPQYDYQPYDHQSYYASYYQQQQQQPYQQNTIDYSASSSSSYYYSANSSYQTQTLDPNSIHPPGVHLSVDPQLSHNLYYQTTPGFPQPGQPAYGGGSSQGGRSIRGGGRGAFGRHGRGGRGGGRGKHFSPRTSASAATNPVEGAAQSSVQGQAAPSNPPPQMGWCELCRVDCNTLDILEKHKNGKKHLRNLKVFEEMQNLSKHVTVTHPQPSQPQGDEAPPSSDVSDKTVPSVAQPTEEAVRVDSSGGRGGLKRKMKPGRGGKCVRTHDGSRRFVEPPKPRQIVHLLCELCNVKCESQVVYESHLAGKKHLSNLKRYEVHKNVYGEGLQALYPAIPNIPLTTVAPPANQDAQALASMLLSNQNLPNPEAAQAALTQLLTEHGIHDAQTLMVQLIPYLLSQVQAPVQLSVPVAGLDTNAADPQNQPLQFSTGNGGQNGDITTEQQNLVNDKPDDGTSEAGKVGAE